MLKKAISSSLFSVGSYPAWLGSPACCRPMFRSGCVISSGQPAKTYADDVNAVILLDDNVTTVKDNGDIVRRVRRRA